MRGGATVTGGSLFDLIPKCADKETASCVLAAILSVTISAFGFGSRVGRQTMAHRRLAAFVTQPFS